MLPPKRKDQSRRPTKFKAEDARFGERIIDVDEVIEIKHWGEQWKRQKGPLVLSRGLGARRVQHRGADATGCAELH